MTRSLRLLGCSLFAAVLAVAGCGDDQNGASDTSTTSSSAPSSLTTESTTTSSTDTTGTDTTGTTGTTGTETTGSGGGEGCWADLFEDDDFGLDDDGDDDDDEQFRLTEPGRYANLDNLPGATRDWTDEFESIRVGPDATVTIWPDTDFGGTPIEIGPGSERADLDDEPESLEMTC